VASIGPGNLFSVKAGLSAEASLASRRLSGEVMRATPRAQTWASGHFVDQLRVSQQDGSTGLLPWDNSHEALSTKVEVNRSVRWIEAERPIA
jgi:hypothetical protein